VKATAGSATTTATGEVDWAPAAKVFDSDAPRVTAATLSTMARTVNERVCAVPAPLMTVPRAHETLRPLLVTVGAGREHATPLQVRPAPAVKPEVDAKTSPAAMVSLRVRFIPVVPTGTVVVTRKSTASPTATVPVPTRVLVTVSGEMVRAVFCAALTVRSRALALGPSCAGVPGCVVHVAVPGRVTLEPMSTFAGTAQVKVMVAVWPGAMVGIDTVTTLPETLVVPVTPDSDTPVGFVQLAGAVNV
jgi:hypothetical protein